MPDTIGTARLPEVRYQRCMVHIYRNVFSHVPSTRLRVSHMLKAIHAQESREAADNEAQMIIGGLRAGKMGKAADLVEQGRPRNPDLLWLPGHSLAEDPNQQSTGADHERDPAQNPRRRCFPDGQSCINLAVARLRYIAGTTWSAKCYMNMRPLYQQHLSETEAVA